MGHVTCNTELLLCRFKEKQETSTIIAILSQISSITQWLFASVISKTISSMNFHKWVTLHISCAHRESSLVLGALAFRSWGHVPVWHHLQGSAQWPPGWVLLPPHACPAALLGSWLPPMRSQRANPHYALIPASSSIEFCSMQNWTVYVEKQFSVQQWFSREGEIFGKLHSWKRYEWQWKENMAFIAIWEKKKVSSDSGLSEYKYHDTLGKLIDWLMHQRNALCEHMLWQILSR